MDTMLIRPEFSVLIIERLTAESIYEELARFEVMLLMSTSFRSGFRLNDVSLFAGFLLPWL
jgi:hypothetical protein